MGKGPILSPNIVDQITALLSSAISFYMKRPYSNVAIQVNR